MGKKIYVGNLTYATTEDALRSLFVQYGTVASVRLITDHYSGVSKGFAFVEMGSDAEAAAAIRSADGTELDGRRIKVTEAIDKPRQDRNSY
jgi:RNA recognition motif-containing protein